MGLRLHMTLKHGRTRAWVCAPFKFLSVLERGTTIPSSQASFYPPQGRQQ